MSFQNKDIEKDREIRRRCYYKHKAEYIKKVHERRERLKVWFNDYKKHQKCLICGEPESVAIDFHHKYGKDVLPSRMSSLGWSIERMKKELKKCVPICANDHRKVHAGLISL